MKSLSSLGSRVVAFAAVLFLPVLAAVANAAPAGVLYRSPLPGARWVSPESAILLRLDHAVAATPAALDAAWAVRGEQSGVHVGHARVLADGRTVSLRLAQPFAADESVDVAWLEPGATGSALAWSFRVSPGRRALPAIADDRRLFEGGVRPSEPAAAAQANDLPADFPQAQVFTTSLASPGELYLSSLRFGGPDHPYRMVLDNSGAPLRYAAQPAPCYDYKIQPNGQTTYYDGAVGYWYVLDSNEQRVDSLQCQSGRLTDLHDLRLLPNGHALLMSYDPEPVDMSAIVPGGDPSATVVGFVVQELDANHDLVFEWRSWDHFAITDATAEDLTAHNIDPVHGNALELDADGALLLSCRNMDEITKIDRTTGDVLWRLGGKHNEFTFTGDTLRFTHQHAIRRIANGHYTLFDNGNLHVPPFSRAVEYAIDEPARTIHTEWEYGAPGGPYAFAMGYVQRLDDGNTLIGWGATAPAVTEVTPDGKKVLEITFPPGVFSYRAYRANAPQYLAVAPGVVRGLKMAFSGANPATRMTHVALELPTDARVDLAIYDLNGRLVRQALRGVALPAGQHRIAVDVSALPPGLFFCRATARGTRGEVAGQGLKLVVAR